MSKYRPGTLEYISWECNWMVEHLTYRTEHTNDELERVRSKMILEEYKKIVSACDKLMGLRTNTGFMGCYKDSE